jgi:hypothetical protein
VPLLRPQTALRRVHFWERSPIIEKQKCDDLNTPQPPLQFEFIVPTISPAAIGKAQLEAANIRVIENGRPFVTDAETYYRLTELLRRYRIPESSIPFVVSRIAFAEPE